LTLVAKAFFVDISISYIKIDKVKEKLNKNQKSILLY